MNTEDCAHEKLTFGSGGYFVICNSCGHFWVCAGYQKPCGCASGKANHGDLRAKALNPGERLVEHADALFKLGDSLLRERRKVELAKAVLSDPVLCDPGILPLEVVESVRKVLIELDKPQ